MIHKLAFSCIPGVGSITAKKIIEVVGSPEVLFGESPEALKTIFGSRTKTIDAILNKSMFSRCEKELIFMEKNQVSALFYTDAIYPKRLKQIPDSPIILYCKGEPVLSPQKALAIVGTRAATSYGRMVVQEIVSSLRQKQDVAIFSGLAYGIDAFAHKASLENEIPTIAVLGHGLDRIYPSKHLTLAQDILSKGGCLVSEFMSESNPDRENFPQRNRIIAGLSDGTVVVEGSMKGGALITAHLAFDYDREVFAIPGRWGDTFSEGCNKLIKSNRAQLLSNSEDLAYFMHWEGNAGETKELSLFLDLSAEEQTLYDLIAQSEGKAIDELSLESGMSLPKISGILLHLEMNDIVVCLPGKVYKICRMNA